MKAAYVSLLIAGLVAAMNSTCIELTVKTCNQNQIAALALAGSITQLCSTYRSYVKCLILTDCFNQRTESSVLITAQKYIKASCDGHIIKASGIMVLLAIFAVLFK